MQTPSFIFGLLDAELRRVHTEMLEKVATKYNLDITELIEEFVTPHKAITTGTKVSVKKDMNPRPLPQAANRCMARVWNRGRGGQCTRNRKADAEFCAHHIPSQKHGRIDEKVTRSMFPSHSTALYK